MVMYRKIRNRCRHLIGRLKSYEGDPRKIALGIAIGVFVGVTPLFPFHTAIALVLATLLKGSRIAAAAGVWVSNPVTLPFFYIATYKTGAFFLGGNATANVCRSSFSELVVAGIDITHAMILGSIVIGFILSTATYFLTLQLFAVLRNRRAIDI